MKDTIYHPNALNACNLDQKYTATLAERKLFTPIADKLLLVMVGLPARGKSFIAKKLCRFLCWKDFHCQVFNAGHLRRNICSTPQDHRFFDAYNEAAVRRREDIALQLLNEIKTWFLNAAESCKNAHVAIFDATNTTRKRRQSLIESINQFAEEHHFSVRTVFIESICTKESVVNANIIQKITFSPDYAHMSTEEAFQDLQLRLRNYEAAYQVVRDDEQLSYIKLFDLQSKVHAKGMYVITFDNLSAQ